MRLRALLALAGIVVALFSDVVFRGRVLYDRDIATMVYPQIESLVRSFAEGSLPSWDPYAGFGQPLLANPGAQVLYPWTWLNLLVSPETYYTLYVLGHLFLSGVGLFLLCRRLGLSPGGSLTAAALWVGSGPLLSLANLWQHFAGAAWIPWVLLAIDHALGSPSVARSLVLGAVAAGQILAGSVDVLAMTALLAAGFSLRYVRPAAAPGVLRRLGAAALAIAFALGLTAAQWLPAMDVLGASSRGSLSAEIRTYWSVPPPSLLQTVLPVFPAQIPLTLEQRALLFGTWEPLLSSLYLGLVSGALVAGALAFSPRRRLVAGLGALGAAAVLFSVGKHSAFYGAALAVLPPLGYFRYPAKALILAAFCWALLAGLGYEAWKGVARTRRSLAAVAPTAVGAASTALLLVALQLRPQALFAAILASPGLPSFSAEALASFRGALSWATWIGAAAAAIVVAARVRPALAAACPAALAALAVIDVVGIHHDLIPSLPRDVLSRPLACVEVIPQRHRSRYFAFDEFTAVARGKAYPSLADAGKRETALQAYRFCMGANRWGMCGSYDMDPLHLYPLYLNQLNLVFAAAEGTPALARLLRVGAVSHVFSLHEEGLDELAPLAGLPEPTRVYRVPGSLPRAYAVSGARVAPDLDALRVLIDPGFDPSREIVLPSGPAAPVEPAFSADVRVPSLLHDRVRIEARLSRPGYVVLVDAYDPDWRATVDGSPAPLLRANVAFRAVPVPAGAHVVEMRYRPRSARVGALVSVAALAVAVVPMARTLRRTREP